MKTAGHYRNAPVVLFVALAAATLSQAAESRTARLFPADTMLLVEVRDLSATIEQFKRTSSYALYKDPAMQPFVVSAERKIRDAIDKALKEMWQEVGIEEPPAELPRPRGRIAMAMRLGTQTVRVPVFDWSNTSPGTSEPTIKEYRSEKTTVPKMIFLADMGEDIEKTQRLLEQMVDKAVDEGWQRRTETVRDVEVTVLTEPVEKDESEDALDMSLPGPDATSIVYGFHGSTLVIQPDIGTSDMEQYKDVLVRLSGEERPSLADDPAYQAVSRKVGSGDVTVYFGVNTMLRSFIAGSEGIKKAQLAKLFHDLGLENLTGLGMVVQIAAKEDQEARVKLLLGVRGRRKGIPAVLVPDAAPTRAGRLLTKGIATYFTANYDLGKMYDGIIAMIQQTAPVNVDALVQGLMAQTAQAGGGQPVNLRRDVLGQLTGPLTVASRITEPYDDPHSSQSLLAFGVQDAAVLDEALGRLHGVFLAAMGDKELQRELRGHRIYLLPIGRMLGGMTDAGEEGGDVSMFAACVAGGTLVVGPVSAVEQAIRDVDREDIPSVTGDPMYQYAARYLPQQASMHFYENQQLTTARLWVSLKKAARKVAESKEEGDKRSLTLGLGVNTSTGLWFPVEGIVEGLKDYCDFTSLPEFEAVKKYWGASTGYMVADEDGIPVEMISLKAPK